MGGLELLRGTKFAGHLEPPDGSRCELVYRFGEPLEQVPAAVRAQRRSLGWPTSLGVSCLAATCSIPVLGLDGEEVVASLDPPRGDGSLRLLIQSLARPELGLTVLMLASDGQRLAGGDESWNPGEKPLITAGRRGDSLPTSPAGAAKASRPPTAPGSKPVAPAKPSQPAPGTRRPAPRSESAGRRGASPSPRAPASPRASARAASPSQTRDGGFGRLGLAVAESEVGSSYDGLDAVIGGEGLGRQLGGAAGRGGEADIARRLAAASASGAGSAKGYPTFQRPDVMTGEPGALDQEIKAAEAEAIERLVSAAAAGEAGDVRLLLARLGPDRAVVSGRHQGLTALMVAAERGRTDVLQLLVEKRAGVEVKDPSGWTALMHAVRGQRPDCVRLLLDAKAAANVAAEADEQKTPLMLAATGARPDLCSALLKAGAQREVRDQEGLKALHHAAKKGNGGALVVLLSARARVDDQDHSGMTPLLLATAAGRAEAVKILLASRADVAAQDLEGRAAAKIASIYDHDRVLKVLNEAGG